MNRIVLKVGVILLASSLMVVVGNAAGGIPGLVVAWGDNTYGQASVPTGLSNIVGIAAGHTHSLAINNNGTVVAWGRNDYGQTNTPAGLSNVVAVAGGFGVSVALKSDGKVVTWGEPSVPAGLSNVVAISAGYIHCLALKSDGTVVAWGDTSNGQGTVPAGLSNVLAVAGGGYFSLALKSNGEVVAWGSNSDQQTNVPPGLSNVVGIAAGHCHCLALRKDGTVVAWGRNDYGQTTVPDHLANVVSIAAGVDDSLALKKDGTMVAWGQNNYGQTNVPPPTVIACAMAIAGGSYHNLALKPTGIALFFDGTIAKTEAVNAFGFVQIGLLNPFFGGALLYTLNGSDPAISGLLYSGPFTVHRTATLRAVAYNADFSEAVTLGPLSVVIVPLNATSDGGGTVSVAPPDGGDFSNGLAVVAASPAPGWTFMHWLGDAAGTNPTITLTMSRDKTVKPVFGTTITTNIVGSGSILMSPTSVLYPYGTDVRLTAVPQTGSYFVMWGAAASGTNNPLTFTVTNASPTITALFALLGGGQSCALTVIPNGKGRVSVTPPGNVFPRNTNVVLQAVADTWQEFLGWSGAASGSENPLTVTMNSNKVITANFTKRPRLEVPAWFAPMCEEGYRLLLTGEFGESFTVAASTNLSDWTPLAMVTNFYGTAQFTDSSATNLAQRFYRAVQP